MALINSEKLIEYLPGLFQTDVTGDIDIFKKLRTILQFDNAFIYFLNSDSIQLKYLYKKLDNVKADDLYDTDKYKKRLFSLCGMIMDQNDELIKNLSLSSYKSFLMSKLFIKSTIFGVIILCKDEVNFYKKDDLDILNAAASIFSYVLKDKELSNVFKIQLKALKDGIIEKNNAYKIIKEQNEKILEADKVKNEFLANISHELRTPLNSILGFADILNAQLYGDLNEKQLEYINDIKVSGTHLLGMINEVLDMSKIEAHAMKVVKSKFMISRAVNEVANILMPIAKKKNVIINTVMDEDFEIFADYQKIQQILYNLCSNAIKYSPEDDTVSIIVKLCDNSYKITVHDNGIGIDPKFHGKIFAKFVQLDNAYTKKESSTGLGLTITKELVELHGGKITLVSEVNNGSAFIVEIPL